MESRMCAALESRDDRQIRRRLPLLSTAVDFNSNDYLSLSTSSILRDLFLKKLQRAPHILGSGGSRLLVNPAPHDALERRLTAFFAVESALLFNSGYDANVGFFSCVPDRGDCVVIDEFIHASVHDGLKASRVQNIVHFKHNCLVSFTEALLQARRTGGSVFVAVESLYSMDGTLSPLDQMINIMHSLFPEGNAHLIVDEAHAVGIYGPDGRGRVAELGLQDHVLATLCTFGKALGCSGGNSIDSFDCPSSRSTSSPIDYASCPRLSSKLCAAIDLHNFPQLYFCHCCRLCFRSPGRRHCCQGSIARFLVLSSDPAKQLSESLLSLTRYFVELLAASIDSGEIPASILSLSSRSTKSAIVPLHTPYAHALSAHLLKHHNILSKPITYPTVPKGKDRVRVCLHAGNKLQDVERFVQAVREWISIQQHEHMLSKL